MKPYQDFSKEVNVGRGSGRLKFSAGQQRRALLEAKLLRSSTLVRGAEAQLPQNLRSQRIRCG